MRRTLVTIFISTIAVVAGGQEPAAAPTFADTLDVRVVELNVAVVDAEGSPVTDLKAEDFAVTVNGQPVEVAGITPPHELAQAADDAQPRQLVLIFDLLSLEKRARKKIVKEIKPFVEQARQSGVQVLLATTSPGFEIVAGFDADSKALAQALDAVAENEVDGNKLMATKRSLRRSIRTAENFKFGSRQPGDDDERFSGQDIDQDIGHIKGSQYLDQVNAIRDHETMRVLHSLGGLEAALYCTAGPARRKDVVWVGEHLLTRPALDLYQTFYTTYEPWADSLDLDRPEIWSQEKDLSLNFERLRQAAQRLHARIHVFDAGDVDRPAGLGDISSIKPMSIESGSQSNRTMSNTGLEHAADWVDGGSFLATATGGISVAGARSADEFVVQLGQHLRSSYIVAYTPPAALDGGLDQVEVRVSRPDLELSSPPQVARMTPDHMLMDRAVSQLLVDLDKDPLDFTVELGQRQDSSDGRYVQSFTLELPTRLLREQAAGATVACHLRVAVALADAAGNVGSPQIFPLELELPAERAAQAQRAAIGFRLLMDTEPRLLGIAVRDEATGRVGGHTLEP